MVLSKKHNKINIGASKSYLPDFLNIDQSCKADKTVNLSEDRLPLHDDSVDLVFTYHTLEHVRDYLWCLGEIYRVMKHGAWLLVGVPYVTNMRNLVNPYHYHNFNEESFDFFDSRKLKGSAGEENNIELRKIFHRVHYFGEFESDITYYRMRSQQYFNVVDRIDFGLVAIKNNNEISLPTESEMISLFDDLLKSRKLYLQEENK